MQADRLVSGSRYAQPIAIGFHWNDRASLFKAAIGNILKFVSGLREDLCHCIAGVAWVCFQNDARAKLIKNPACAPQGKMFEAFHIDLYEIGLDLQFLDNRIKRAALHLYDSATLPPISIQCEAPHR